MIESGLIFGLPLLTKDLIEQSARSRTYVLRVVYAAFLYGSALWVYAEFVDGGILNLGRGRQLFQWLIQIQFLAIIILLPALSCGAITSEKERDTLGLLLLTRLSPRAIILEKLLSRLVAMGTFQLLSLPLFAVVYGLGGVELFEIIAAIWFLMWWSAVIGSLSIYCSTWHRTTAGAFVAAYSMMPAAFCIAACCLGVVSPAMTDLWHPQASLTGLRLLLTIVGTLMLLGIMSMPMIILTTIAVVAAQSQLVERAFVPPRNVLLEFFKKLDKFFEELNERTTSGIVLVQDRDTGPVFEPIAWRETRKKSLGTVRYLFRLLVVLEGPLILTLSWAMIDASSQATLQGPTVFFLAVLWPIAVLAITVHATNIVFSERTRQTLDILLVAPLTCRQMIYQKMAGVSRLIWVLTVPFLTLIVCQSIWALYVVRDLYLFRNSFEGSLFLHELLGMALAMIVYPRIIQWMSFYLALRMKNQTQTVLLIVAVVIVICVMPLVAVEMAVQGVMASNAIVWLSPIRVLFHRLFLRNGMSGPSTIAPDHHYLGLMLHAVVFTGLWLTLRRLSLKNFSRLVGRCEPSEVADVST